MYLIAMKSACNMRNLLSITLGKRFSSRKVPSNFPNFVSMAAINSIYRGKASEKILCMLGILNRKIITFPATFKMGPKKIRKERNKRKAKRFGF